MASAAMPDGGTRTTRVLVCTVPLILMVGLRIYRAFSTPMVLDWDETYYMSMAVTAAAGHGLYAYIFGFPPMPVMGGNGYAAYSYAIAVKLFGPTIYGLRFVSLAASLLGLAGVWVLVKRWYGSGAAWMAMSLVSGLQLFALSNTARMDSWTFAYVTWGLVAVAAAFEQWGDRRRHLLAGLLFGLGLQVHIDAIATAMACGILYLVRYLGDARAAGRPFLPKHPMFLYVSGIAVGLLVYVCVNILPDPAAYYKATVLIRIDATGSYSGGTTNIFSSFLNPRILFSKEAVRYGQLAAMSSRLELGLVAVSVLAMAVRRNAADKLVLILLPAVLAAAAIVLNNASPLYFIHVLPAVVIPIAPLFTHGFTGQRAVPLGEVRSRSLVAFALVMGGLCAINGGKSFRASRNASLNRATPPESVQRVRVLVDRRCKLVGDGGLYVPYFADYPFYISLRNTEVKYAMLFEGTSDELAYWKIKQPDVVFQPGSLRTGLADYVVSDRLTEVEPGIWMRSGACKGGP